MLAEPDYKFEGSASIRRPLILWGATGQSIVLHEFLTESGFRLEAVVDNDPAIKSPFEGVPLLHGINGLKDWIEGETLKDHAFVVAIGGNRGGDRCHLSEQLDQLGLRPIQAIHPSSMVARDAFLGRGVQILMGGIVCARATLGDWVIVNTGASVDHECRIGSGVHIGPKATLCGCVEVGPSAFIGAGAVVLPRVHIGAGSIIGAGSVVTRNIPEGVIACGNPARIIRST